MLAEAGKTEVRCNEKIIHNDSESDTGTGARRSLPAMEVCKMQLNKESSEQPGLTLALSLL